jgi:hypothetical protein
VPSIGTSLFPLLFISGGNTAGESQTAHNCRSLHGNRFCGICMRIFIPQNQICGGDSRGGGGGNSPPISGRQWVSFLLSLFINLNV